MRLVLCAIFFSIGISASEYPGTCRKSYCSNGDYIQEIGSQCEFGICSCVVEIEKNSSKCPQPTPVDKKDPGNGKGGIIF